VRYMAQGRGETVSFKREGESKERIKEILKSVHKALEEKGYNPVNQMVGYMISGDPAYITSHNDARSLICKVDRDEIMEVLVREYLSQE
jgi:uncharacterized protein (UPF0297 family)